MIYLYSGTPGSGKSLHTARVIKGTLRMNKPVICNFEINKKYVKNYDKYTYYDNSELTPNKLIEISNNYFNGSRVREGQILVVIDEAQMIFNARDYNSPDRKEWNKFFQVHRHYGIDVILCAQFDRMLDRQIRSLIEYEVIHRKVSNFGLKGKFLCTLLLAPHLFCSVKMWYPMKEKIGSEFFRYNSRLGKLYDTYNVFN